MRPGMSAALIPEGLRSIIFRNTGTNSQVLNLAMSRTACLLNNRGRRSFGEPTISLRSACPFVDAIGLPTPVVVPHARRVDMHVMAQVILKLQIPSGRRS